MKGSGPTRCHLGPKWQPAGVSITSCLPFTLPYPANVGKLWPSFELHPAGEMEAASLEQEYTHLFTLQSPFLGPCSASVNLATINLGLKSDGISVNAPLSQL